MEFVYVDKNTEEGYLRKHELDTTGLQDIPFGREMMKREFALKSDIIFLNHGAYGTVPRRVLHMQHGYNAEREEHPDLFFRITARRYLDQTRRALAHAINASRVDNVVVVTNATTALNTVVKNYPFHSGDAILDTSETYESIQTLVQDFTSRVRPDVERVSLKLRLPIDSEDEIVALYEDVLDKHPEIRVAIVDHVTSPSAIVLPVSRLVRVCHDRGVLVFVDGAHVIGQLPLDVEEIGADVYTTNMHKWAYSPKSAALVWFAERHRKWMKPLVTSWRIKEAVDLQFYDQGTRDIVPFIAARHGLEFYQAIGGRSRVVAYTSSLADKALELLCEIEGVEALRVPKSMEAPNMKLVKLPRLEDFPVQHGNTWVLQKALFGQTRIFGLIVLLQEDFYIRFSVQIYNEMDDFLQLAVVLRDFLHKHKKT